MNRLPLLSVLALAGLVTVGAASGPDGSAPSPAPSPAPAAVPAPGAAATCTPDDPDTPPPAYYTIELVPTGRLPGTARAKAGAELSFARSPFGIALSPDGTYVYDLRIAIDEMRPPRTGVLVAWVTTRDLDQVRRIGVLGDDLRAAGQVHWNKYLLVITLEPDADRVGDAWTGPVVFRGMSRSGLMHTMAGHGPFAQEPCATYGY